MADMAEYEKEHDPWIYRMVTFFLGVITLSCIAVAFYSTYISGVEKEFPQFLTSVGSASGGALVAMLSNPPK